MKNYYDLKFFADMHCKLADLSLHLNDNYWYNIDQCMRGEDEPHMVARRDVINSVSNIWGNHVNPGLSDLVKEHELWDVWGESNIGDNVRQQTLLGVVLGLIRFEPPKNTKKTSNRSGKERWAHSEGSLLNYCGFGSGTSPNRHIRNVLCELVNSMVFGSDEEHPYMKTQFDAKYPNYKVAYMNTYRISMEDFDVRDDVKIVSSIISNMAMELVVTIYNTYHRSQSIVD